MKKCLLDTNIVILYLSGAGDVSPYVENTKYYSFLSTITIAELLSKPSLTKSEQNLIQGLVSKFDVLDFDTTIAYATANLKRKYKSLKTPDAILAATAQVHALTFVTKDKGFNKIKEIKVVEP